MMDELKNLGSWSEYLDIDFGLSCIGMCVVCGAPIMENERKRRVENGFQCENCMDLQEEKN